MENPKENKRSCSRKQKEILINFLKSHPDLQKGQFTSSFTFKKARALWDEVTIFLNSQVGGSVKNWKQWRRVSYYW